MDRPGRKISYIKKPMAKRSYFSTGCVLVSLLSAALSLYISMRNQGNGGVNVAAWGLTSIIFSVISIGYGVTSFMEKDMNYILAKISVVISGALLVFWLCLVVTGIVAA